MEKNIKSHTKTINLRYLGQHEMKDLSDGKMPDGSYSASDIQDYFQYIIKKHKTVADNYHKIRK